MELTEKSLVNYMVMTNGIKDGIKREDLDLFFENIDKDVLHMLGKTRRGRLYPCNRIWKETIDTIIKQSNIKNNKILRKRNGINDKFNDGITEIKFNSYLSKRQITKLVNVELFDFNKNNTEITLINKEMQKIKEGAKNQEAMIYDYLSSISLTFEDTVRFIKIKDEQFSKLMIGYGYVKENRKNIYELNEGTMLKIFVERLMDAQSSIESPSFAILKKKRKMIVINTLLNKEMVDEALTNYIEKKYKIVSIDEKKAVNGEKYLQFTLIKKKKK